ncbi:MAG: 3'-5' exonuclease domain-containing protein 2, partial [bacterium]|nr:3'-5' exonuclease domain-containing protein 2 [bacterium]
MVRIQANRLSRDYINVLPIIRFEGDIVVVNTPEMEEKVIKTLNKETFVGFDTESRPSFKKGVSYPISVVQLANHKTAYLLQVGKTGFTDALAEFLANPAVKK